MDTDARRTAILGIVIGALGLICLGGGIALLIWRIAQPDKSVILPPGAAAMEVTPTPGLLGSPIPPPPLPTDSMIVLPVDILPTVTPTEEPSQTPTITPSRTAPPPTATQTHTPTQTASPAPTLPRPTNLPTATERPTETATASPAPTLTATPTELPTSTVTPSPTPTVQPAPDIPDRIIIESIGLDASVIPVGEHSLQIGNQTFSQWDVPNVYAAGWHQSSAPLGQMGNTVINGHHNAYGEVFRYLIAVQPGDSLILEAKGRRYLYIVSQTMVLPEEGEPISVRRENARWILPTTDERVTLITCWPYTSNTHRLIVIALPAASPERPSNMP